MRIEDIGYDEYPRCRSCGKEIKDAKEIKVIQGAIYCKPCIEAGEIVSRGIVDILHNR